jgi:tRNA(fMet)-specific endonuclease VapC
MLFSHSELLFGAFNSIKKKQNLEKIEEFLDEICILNFCRESSRIFAEQKSQLKKQGTIIADMDLMIASITLQNQGILITNNTKHFLRKKIKN